MGLEPRCRICWRTDVPDIYFGERSFQKITFCLLAKFIDFDLGCGIFLLILVGEHAKVYARMSVQVGEKFYGEKFRMHVKYILYASYNNARDHKSKFGSETMLESFNLYVHLKGKKFITALSKD